MSINTDAPELSEGFPAQQQDPPGVTGEMDPLPDHGEDSYEGSGRLEGRRALITGGDSGIGRAVAIAYAREGADVAITYMPEEVEDAASTAKLIEAAGRKALTIEVDLRTREECDRTIAETVEALGGLDILVNNAAFQMAREEGIGSIEDDYLDRTFKTNLYALFWLTRAALPHLGQGSSVINTTSIQAYEPSPTLLDYASTKAAINNFTINLAGELGPRASASTPSPPARSGPRCSRRPRRRTSSPSSARRRRSAVPDSRPSVRRRTSFSRRSATRAMCRARCSASREANRSSDRGQGESCQPTRDPAA